MAKKSKFMKWLPYMIVVVLIVGGLSWFFYAQSIVPPSDDVTPSVNISTFEFLSCPDGENKNNLVPGAIYLPTATAEFEDWEDITNIAGNFLLETTKLGEDLKIDLTDVPFAWLKINPDGPTAAIPFDTDWKLLSGGVNTLRTYNVYDRPAAVFNNLYDANLDVFTGLNINGSHTVVLDVNHTLADGIHVGTGWDMSALAYAELSTTKAAEYLDEKFWTCLGNTYAPTADEMTVYPRYELEYYTTCWAIELTFDGTVADGSNPVNFVDPNTPAEIIIVADVVYVVFYETINFLNGMYTFGLNFTTIDTTATTLNTIDIGTIVVPRGAQFALGAFTSFP